MHSSRSTFKARPAAAWVFALAVSVGSFWLQAPQAGALPLEPAVHPPVGEEAPHHRPQGSDASHAHAELTLERIHDELSQHIARVRDLTARVSFVQVSPRDGSKIEGELELAAIVPDLARATWVKPEIYAGVFYILDAQANQYIEYVPATGEAHRMPLDQILAGQPLVRIAPEQIFSLPPAEQFILELTDVAQVDGVRYAVVQATDKASGQVYRVWVDTGRWLVTRMQALTPKGDIQASAEVLEIRVNEGLEATALRRLPPGTIQRSFP